MKQPLVNWDALMEMARPMPQVPKDGKGPKGMPKSGYGGWDEQAELYDMMVKMESEYTPLQIACLPITKEDTVLDVCCGTGRLVVPVAQIAKSVTGLDASSKMLEHCKTHAEEAGLSNVTTQYLDWDEAEAGKNVEKHDIVIASRNMALQDPVKLSSFANKWVGIIIWSFGAPPIPAIRGKLFKGLDDSNHVGHRPPMGMMGVGDRRLGNNVWYNRIYDLGYEVNMRVVEDGYKRVFASRDDAYAELAKLRSEEIPNDKMEIYKSNVDEFLSENNGETTFFAPTESIVLWWKPERTE